MQMGETARHISDVQKQTNADDVALGEARARRDEVLVAGRSFPGVAGSFMSGSLAAGVVTEKVEDADGGLIADRRCYPGLGPDGGGDTPAEVVADLQDHVGPIVREKRPDAVVRIMKRGLRVWINEPLADGQDPYVDMVFAMPRKDAEGLWIPNLDAGCWDPSHPQKHVELLTDGSRSLRRTRAQVIRLGKVWNKQYTEPGLNSFNMCAVGLESVTATGPIDQTLLAFFEHAFASLAVRRTEDPAGVSGPISLEQPKQIVLGRLRQARDALAEALDHNDDPDAAQAAMHRLFWLYVPEPAGMDSKAAVAGRLRTSTPRLRPAVSGVGVAGLLKPKRSFGARRR
jgi:hypothetical protein